jgi:phospholipid/cholesterol/gamma-HCH transport system ATP-binding protein
VIDVQDVWKAYGDLEVLKGLSIKVETGETLVILGRSGVGKSVLLRLLLGLEKPQKGEIFIDKVNMNRLSEKELYQSIHHMGMLFQGGALFDSMTIEENTGFYFHQHPSPDIPEEEVKKRVDEALHLVGLDDSQKKFPSQLSGGMRKRAALARLIVYRPTLILYDEPTTGLDPITAQQISDLIVKIQNELKATSVVVTHDIQCALTVGNRLALHNEGRITHVAPPKEFFKIKDPIIEFLSRLTYHTN